MRTKTLLLTAALSAAGMATSMAQVYSVNAVGYVNTTLKPGFNLVSNPLIASNNSIASLFAGVPSGTRVFTFGEGGFTTYSYVGAPLNRWTPDASTPINAGDGVFVLNPGTSDITVTFVGEVPQGAASNQSLPAGLSIKGSKVPQAGTVAELQFPAAPGDRIFKFDPVNGYSTFSYAGAPLNRWTPSVPTIDVGEAVFVSKVAAANWDRNFSVNQ